MVSSGSKQPTNYSSQLSRRTPGKDLPESVLVPVRKSPNQTRDPSSRKRQRHDVPSNMKEAESPIRKQLVKKLVGYFDTLENFKRQDSRGKSSDRSRSRSKRNSTSRGLGKSVLEQYEEEHLIEHYEDQENRAQRLEELKDLMKAELIKVKQDNQTEYDAVDIYKSGHGYPSFMKGKHMQSRTGVTKSYVRRGTKEYSGHDFKANIHKKLE